MPVLKYVVPALIILLILGGIVFFLSRENNQKSEDIASRATNTQQGSIVEPSAYVPVKGLQESYYPLVGSAGGKVSLTSVLNQTLVNIVMEEENAKTYSAFVYSGTCGDIGEKTYTLTRVINGSSETTLDKDMKEFMAKPQAIALSDTSSLPIKIVSCANIN